MTGLLEITGSGKMEDYDENNNNRTPWYYHSFYIMKCTIGNGVTSIGNQAFYCCDRLTDITIPNSVTSISNGVFANCSKLVKVIMPNSINNISYSKFIDGLNKAGIEINRKMLSELAIDNREAFADLVTIAKDALAGKSYTPKEVKVESKLVGEENDEIIEETVDNFEDEDYEDEIDDYVDDEEIDDELDNDSFDDIDDIDDIEDIEEGDEE